MPTISFTQHLTYELNSNTYKGKIVIDGNEGNAQWDQILELKPFRYKTSSKDIKIITDIDSLNIRQTTYDSIEIKVAILKQDTAHVRIVYSKPYLDILKEGNKYSTTSSNEIPEFVYQDSTNKNLVKLRSNYKLDSIAGNGNESSRIINLMEWVHNKFKHNGSVLNPKEKNTTSYVEQCKIGNGITCRGLAIVLNELYLAIGIPSRIVTCMPKEKSFDECHVINSVFNKELGKWIWIDPTHEAYVMDENGNLLSIIDVRNKLVNSEPLILNPEANWNHQESTTKEYYLYQYMAKNLYRLEIPLHSKYNFETFSKGKTIEYLEVLPIDGYNQTPKVKHETNYETGAKIIKYKTNNLSKLKKKPIKSTDG